MNQRTAQTMKPRLYANMRRRFALAFDALESGDTATAERHERAARRIAPVLLAVMEAAEPLNGVA